jgi:outer membrane protein OmpA-like peptidoglycan-associated protein
MFRRTAALLLASGVLSTGVAFSQPVPNPTQQLGTVSQDQLPVFRVTIVGRTLPAINYRPRRGDTKIDFAGTALLPKAEGHATVAGEQGYMKIDARFNNLEPAQRFGREYLTYVLWAVTPEGRAVNLGEIQVNNDDAKVQLTTQLQAFGLIVTAEPYFAVTQPSDVVVIENVIRGETTGSFEVVQAKYELLKRGSYLMNQEASALKSKALEPGATLDLAEARNAVELSRIAGADRFATDTYNKAAKLLADAEQAKTSKRGNNAIMMPARQAAQTAEDARIIALQKQEDAFLAAQRAEAAGREQTALNAANDEAMRRRRAELDTQAATAARNAAERGTAEADAARLAAERGAANADAARLTAERGASDADAARMAAEAARAQAESAQRDAEAKTQQAQNAANQSEQEKAALRERLRVQLNVVLDTRETARGLIINLSDVLFDTGSANLKPGAREKLARVSGILVSQQGLRLEVEGHTDSVGSDASNQSLSERRAESVRTYLIDQKIVAATVGTAGFGESKPVATNDTASGRQQNRRVELVVSGDIIGRR